MNNRDRFLTAMDMREPDTVPITEIGIDRPVVEAIIGRETKTENWITDVVECYQRLDFDAIRVRGPTQMKSGTFVDEWGCVKIVDTKTGTAIPYGSRFKTVQEYEQLQLPDPHNSGLADILERAMKLIDGKMAVCSAIKSPFVTLWETFGVQNFSLELHSNPRGVAKLMDRMTEFNLVVIEILAEVGVDFILGDGDYAEKNGPMISPRYFQQMIFPNLKREVDLAHSKGIKYIKHSDGNLNPILDDLARIVDGIHSIDPSAGMDIGRIKERYRDKLILMGNVSADNLCLKSRDEVIAETKECIRQASPGGGHVLTSSNSWYADMKLENCLAMVETARKHGKYPIRL